MSRTVSSSSWSSLQICSCCSLRRGKIWSSLPTASRTRSLSWRKTLVSVVTGQQAKER
jgi:hypothetical protein